MTDRAVAVLQQSSVQADRQMRLVLDYLAENGYVLAGLVRYQAAAAVAMVAHGEAVVVVAAFAVRSGGLTAVAADIIAAGGRVEYCREPHARMRRDADELAAKMIAKGIPMDVIADLLELPEQKVRTLVADRLRRPAPDHPWREARRTR